MLCPKCNSQNPEDSRYCGHCATPLADFDTRLMSNQKTPEIIPDEIPIKSVIKEKFLIEEKLGAGGMGVVYKAQDLKLKRTVALKFLSLELTRDWENKERFRQEAQAASALDHQNICTIFEIEETDDGQMFIVMAYYDGETLKEKIQRGPLSVSESTGIVIQVAEALIKAHSHSIIHRDIKPANIMITNEGIVKILDFGLAKQITDSDLTLTAAVKGTVAYMSPEQVRGEAVDQRTDIWSLGVVLYEMLVRRPPYAGENLMAVMHSILTKPAVPPVEERRDIPLELERVILNCLNKNQDERYQTAQQLLHSLTRVKRKSESEKTGETIASGKRPVVRKEAERRQATVLYAEITGYEDFLAHSYTEEVAYVMTECFKIFGFIEEKYASRVHKITDNSIRVVFGIPTAIEDAPRKAVNVSIELRNKIHRFNQKEDLIVPLDIRIGVDTGIVVVGAVDAAEKEDYIIMGEAADFALQLKDLSSPGQIIVGPQVHRYTQKIFDFKELRSVTPKGKKDPIVVYELLSESERIFREGLGSERMIFSDMVGRDRQFDKLMLQALKTLNGIGSIVTVCGEAGIGKSRLVAEVAKNLEEKRIALLKGRALSIGKNLSFHPIIDLIKNWVGIQEDDSGVESAYRLEKFIMNIYPEAANEIFPFVATLMGMKLAGEYANRVRGIEGEALEKLILKNLRELLGKASERKPLVVILEDLHWADLTSIGILESLYRLVEKYPILFINVLRPGYEETSERLIKTIRSRYDQFYSNINLESLDDEQSDVLINNLLKIKGFAPSVRELVVKKSGGNPFFIEEVVRSFIDDGVVEIENGNFRVTEKIDSVVIPETISDVLMARIDKLDEGTRSLLKVASVIGRNFFYKILVDVAKSVEEIDERLSFLKETQLILERQRMEELEYLFKHALAQEATYESILLKKRKALHLKIADSIESVFSERLHEFYGMLALHYSKGENLDKAEEYLIKAGEEALKSSASSEALHFYKEALRIYLGKTGDSADADKIAMLEKNIALALYNRGQYVEADEFFSKVLTYYGERLPKNTASMYLKFSLGFLRFLACVYFPFLQKEKIPTQRDSEIINLFYKKNTALIFLDPVRMFIEIFYWLWRLINFDLSKIENGIEIISMSSAAFSYGSISFRFSKKVLAFIQDKIDESDAKSVLHYKLPDAILKTFSGDWANIIEYDEGLVDKNVKIGELFYASGYVLIHGYSKINAGYFDISMRLAEKLYDMADTYENDYARAAHYWYKTQVLLKFRKLPEALNVSEEGIRFTDKTGFRPYMFSLCAFRAGVLTMLGDAEEANNLMLHLQSIQSEINLVPYFLTTFYLSQWILELQLLEDFKRSEKKADFIRCRKKTLKTAKKAIKFSRKIAADTTESFKLMGTYNWIVGRQKKAIKFWKKSIRAGEELGARLELSRTFFEIGTRLSEKTSRYKELNGITPRQYISMANELFKEMGLEWDLRSLDRIENDSCDQALKHE